MIEAALKRFREEEGEGATAGLVLDDLIDHEFVRFCAREADDGVTLEQVLEATSTIKDSMSRAIIDDERAERL